MTTLSEFFFVDVGSLKQEEIIACLYEASSLSQNMIECAVGKPKKDYSDFWAIYYYFDIAISYLKSLPLTPTIDEKIRILEFGRDSICPWGEITVEKQNYLFQEVQSQISKGEPFKDKIGSKGIWLKTSIDSIDSYYIPVHQEAVEVLDKLMKENPAYQKVIKQRKDFIEERMIQLKLKMEPVRMWMADDAHKEKEKEGEGEKEIGETKEKEKGEK